MQKILLAILFHIGIILGIVLTFYNTAQASHVMGSDLTYSCIGPNQYRVTLRVFRDCDGIDMPTSFAINYSGCGNSGSLTVSLQNTIDITPLCPSQTSRCAGGSSPIGAEQYTYTGTVTLPSGCNNWVLSTSTCCRNGAITNLSSPSSNNFYIQTTLNNTITPCNSSPVFASPPTPFMCVNQPVVYQQLATDPDGDQLVYSLTNCLQAAGSNVTYNGGFNGANPLTNPITINASTGEMTFTPTTPQIAAVCVRVEEYRGGVKIGEIIRDMQFVVQNCTNQVPTLSGINGVPGVYSISSCAGNTICFNVNATDANAGDNLSMSFIGNIPGSTFTQSGSGNNRTGTFCWTPALGVTGTFVFSVQVTDNACPIPGLTSRAYTVIITPNPNPPVNAGPDVAICAGQSTILTATTAALNASSYQWSPTVGLSSSTTASTTASPSATTNYTVTLTYTDGCRSTDAVLVTINPDPVANATPATANVCAGANFLLTGTTDATGMTFQWFTPAMASLGSGTVSGTTSTILITAPAAAGSYNYTLRVTNPVSGCTSQDIVTLIVGAPPALPACVNIYASPTGLVGNPGTQASPTTLAEALNRAACQNAVIKLAIGTYNISSPLYLSSYVTIEGGFNPGAGWTKTSLAGATVINRTNAAPEGPTNGQYLVAFYGNSVTGFRLQDLTITTAAGTAGTGMSTYGVHLTNCSNYNFIRTQILPGAAGSGAGDDNPATYNPTWDGANGANGANGSTGGGPQCTCNISTDNGGSGGNGGGGGNGGANATIIGGSATNGVAGGRGGDGRPDNTSAAGFNGTAGTSAAPATGGAGGTGGSQDGNGNSTSNVGNGGVGGAGSDGTAGTTTAGTHVAGFYVPGSGSNGTAGRGGAGGGGGGGAGRDTDNCDAAGGGGSGGGGGGGGGGAGRGGFGGGSSFGLYLYLNGTGGVVNQSNVVAGAAGASGLGGTGGLGGNGGTSAIGNGCTNGDSDGNRGGAGGTGGRGGNGGAGGAGGAGLSIAIHLQSGTALATNVSNFSLAAQPVITVTNVNCTNTNVTYTSAAPAAWDFDATTNNATPGTAGAVSPTTTQYTQIGRYNIGMGANSYLGFHNISFTGAIVPIISTNATQLGVDTFQLCAGQFAIFESVYYADAYQWNFNGAVPNPGSVRVTNSTQFNTPGFYPITLNLITDCCGLSIGKTIYLFVDRVPTATGSGAASICPGNSTTLTLSGLLAADSVVWTPSSGILSSTSSSITVSPTSTITYTASIYSKTVTNGRTRVSCPVNRTFPITVNNQPVITPTLTQPTCGNNGSITATVTFGGGLYNFVWSSGQTTLAAASSTINSLAAGVYSVTATNTVTGCRAISSSFLYPAPAAPMVYLQTSTPATCGNNNGTATVNTSGGTAPFTYAWSSGGAGNNRTNLAGGNYCVTVTDANTCRSTTCFNITSPGGLTINLLSSSNVSCPGGTGSATVEAVGGQGVINYVWSNGETGPVATALPSGTSTVTATSSGDGCSSTMNIILITTNTASTAPTIAPVGTMCPNTTVTLNAAGGTAGTGSNIYWYSGANGTGSLLGTGSSVTVTLNSTTTIYARRQGTCNNSSDASITVNVKTYIYATNGMSTSNYCTDNAGWHHFFIGDDIIFSAQGDLSNAPVGFPLVTIWDNNAYYQNHTGSLSSNVCAVGLSPGEEQFEMERSWNLDMGGGAPIGSYNIRFYYQPAERTAIETAAINWMTTYPACGYTYKYATPLGFYWFKNSGSNYTAPDYDATHYTGTGGSTVNGINYAQWAGIPSFSGGSGAVIIVPDVILDANWLYFNGSTDGHINHLEWATAQEDGTSHFEVQRSLNGIDFQTIGTVDAAGNSSSESYYSFDDNKPFAAINYYRLRLVNLDGSELLSNIVALEIGKDGKGYTFFPNPTEDAVNYQFTSDIQEEIEIEVLDVLGRRLSLNLKTAQVGVNLFDINLSEYPDGSYIVRAKHQNSGAVHTAKIIKNKK